MSPMVGDDDDDGGFEIFEGLISDGQQTDRPVIQVQGWRLVAPERVTVRYNIPPWSPDVIYEIRRIASSPPATLPKQKKKQKTLINSIPEHKRGIKENLHRNARAWKRNNAIHNKRNSGGFKKHFHRK